MGDLVKYENSTLIKWSLKAPTDACKTEKSSSFTIQHRKCFFLFHSGFNSNDENRQPISLLIDFDENEKLNPSLNVILSAFSSSKRIIITGERKQMIWSSYNYDLRGSLISFEMAIMNDTTLKGK